MKEERTRKAVVKRVLGELPITAELAWYLRQTGKPPVEGYSLKRLEKALPGWCESVKGRVKTDKQEKRVVIFGMLRYWIEHVTLLGLSLAAQAHDVTLGYLPYRHWKKPVNRFDLRRQNLYVRAILKRAEPLLRVVSLLDLPRSKTLPSDLEDALEEASFRDVQYSLLRENVDQDKDLYRLRLERNTTLARIALLWLETEQPEVIIVPNGSILEFGIVFKVARYLGIPVITYEFGEQSERMWMAQNADVMLQDTDDLWEARKDYELTEEEWERVRTMFAARQGGGLWENFSRRWQGTSSHGEEQTRINLGLDTRPIVLLPTNVLGDSLTLGRQLFSQSMTEWLIRTIQYFERRPEVQFVIRIHPGEQIGWGPSVYDILKESFPELPDHVHILPADAPVNTYDLVNIADCGLVFTTTVGMEMAMSGLPVIVSGQTHYRGKGFTLDPDTWRAYFKALDRIPVELEIVRPSRRQVELAWTYAYRFFFEYPRPYPWHVQHFWGDVENWSLERVFSEEGQKQFGETFRNLVGYPITWTH